MAKKETMYTPIVVMTWDVFSQFMDKTNKDTVLSLKLTQVVCEIMLSNAITNQVNEKEELINKILGESGRGLS